MANLVPLNLTHRTLKDTSVGATQIPGDTYVITLLSVSGIEAKSQINPFRTFS